MYPWETGSLCSAIIFSHNHQQGHRGPPHSDDVNDDVAVERERKENLVEIDSSRDYVLNAERG